MTATLFKYLLVAFYALATLWLSYIGMRKTADLKGFSIGNKDMSPYLVGVTLAASIASTATFVINPGFVYTHGVAAYLHFGVAASAGILVAFITLTRGFARIGARSGAITIPDWIYHRYQHRGLSLFFAFINLLSIAFVVLILVGCSLLVSNMFPLSRELALVLVLLFVFSYVLMGGTYAHAYTNTLQGIMMLAIAAFLAFDGWYHFDGDVLQSLRSVGANYAALVNPDSELYGTYLSVFVSGFVVTFALMLQPHILTKTLYLKSEADTTRFIVTATLVGFVFSQMLLLGFYARLAGVESPVQDAVVVNYLLFEYGNSEAGQLLLAFIFVTLLAAGMSTLDGILVSLSSMVVNDIYLPLSGKTGSAGGLHLSRVVLVGVGCIAALLAWNPPQLVGLFAQKGVYALAAASVVPILFGVFVQRPLSPQLMFCCAAVGLFGHLCLNLFMGVANPAVSATLAIAAALVLGVAGLLWPQRSPRVVELE
ncbi:sodium:solute symporter family transporter [Pseudomaricurvus alcaniphilus]|uniref:sodium:solute symporter family transporter n=1 Tax=Pseudomaricurvus alcaniphilus TaxID=1166482 RepID=UPI001FB76C3E|nr:sodium:solute symporter family protein [Pseudomaricurvus alcaniphilus]